MFLYTSPVNSYLFACAIKTKHSFHMFLFVFSVYIFYTSVRAAAQHIVYIFPCFCFPYVHPLYLSACPDTTYHVFICFLCTPYIRKCVLQHDLS